MLTVSLHGIKLHAPYGLYEQEHVLGNDFEVDVDVWVDVAGDQPWPFVDYTMINGVVRDVFAQPRQLLEEFVQNIVRALKQSFTEAAKVRVAVRKLHPPMEGSIAYSQVCFEG